MHDRTKSVRQPWSMKKLCIRHNGVHYIDKSLVLKSKIMLAYCQTAPKQLIPATFTRSACTLPPYAVATGEFFGSIGHLFDEQQTPPRASYVSKSQAIIWAMSVTLVSLRISSFPINFIQIISEHSRLYCSLRTFSLYKMPIACCHMSLLATETDISKKLRLETLWYFGREDMGNPAESYSTIDLFLGVGPYLTEQFVPGTYIHKLSVGNL